VIITRPRDAEALREDLSPFEDVAVLGCGICAAACRTGGPPEVAAMAEMLASMGRRVIWTHVVEGVCQKQLTGRALANLPPAGVILVMSCGSGVQTVAGLGGPPVIPALDSLSVGSIVRVGRFVEKCSLCGRCTVHRFDGRCTVTLCPKHLQNGPCGGMEGGKCETDPGRDCVWYQIWQSKQSAGTSEDLLAVVPPRGHRR
jgi:ferredoxin